MSKRVEALVWERSRAGKSELLLLVKIADLCAEDTGHNCFAEVPYLAKQIRAKQRGTQYILNRLLASGEIEIEYNDDGQEITLRGGRRFQPKWFIHVRCVCAWDAYQREAEEPANIADSETSLRPGRPRRKHAKIADSRGAETRKDRPINAQEHAPKPAKTGSAYKEGSVFDPVVELEQGAAPRLADEKANERTPEENLGVITKLAHEVLELHALNADVSERDIVDGIELRCSPECFNIATTRDRVYRAIESAVYQRCRAGKSPVLKNSPGDSAFRMQAMGARA